MWLYTLILPHVNDMFGYVFFWFYLLNIYILVSSVSSV